MLVDFRKKYPTRWPTGIDLAGWCERQRSLFRRKKLSRERILLLKKIHFEFIPLVEKNATIWLEQYRHLVQFRKKHPNRWPRYNERFPENNNLGGWCIQQRHRHLPNDRIDLLKKIGFEWKPNETAWQERYSELVQFRKRHPHDWPRKGMRLAVWCNKQRTFKPSEDRVRLLDAIGFEWNMRDAVWSKQYQYLIEFRKKFPKRWPRRGEQYPKGNELGVWCASQRASCWRKELPKERILLLEKEDFQWDSPHEVSWRNQYQFLARFRRRYPDRWPSNQEEYPQGNKLGKWCIKQRGIKRQGKLSRERFRLLSQLRFEWDAQCGVVVSSHKKALEELH